MMDFNAVVIGGGPAGLSASIGLARAGYKVKIFEQRKEWTGRVCGSFLSPESMEYLKWLEILDQVKEKSVHSDFVSIHVSGQSINVPIRRNGCSGLAIPRRDLEEILIGQANKNGVDILFGARVSNTFLNQNGIWEVKIREADKNAEIVQKSHVLVAADGRFSSSRDLNSRFDGHEKEGWYGWATEFTGAVQKPGELSLHFFPNGYIGTLTYKDGITNVCGLIHSDFKKKSEESWIDLLTHLIFKERSLIAIFKDAVQINQWRGIPPLPFGQYVERGQNLFLAGDSAGVFDPFMGEGIARALGSGPMVYNLLMIQKNISTDKRSIFRKYHRIWKNHYNSRSRVSSLIRYALKREWTLSMIFSLLKNYRWLQTLILSRIHSTSIPG